MGSCPARLQTEPGQWWQHRANISSRNFPVSAPAVTLATHLAQEQHLLLEGNWIWTGVKPVFFRTSYGLGTLRKFSRKNTRVHACFSVRYMLFPISCKRSQILFSPFFSLLISFRNSWILCWTSSLPAADCCYSIASVWLGLVSIPIRQLKFQKCYCTGLLKNPSPVAL